MEIQPHGIMEVAGSWAVHKAAIEILLGPLECWMQGTTEDNYVCLRLSPFVAACNAIHHLLGYSGCSPRLRIVTPAFHISIEKFPYCPEY